MLRFCSLGSGSTGNGTLIEAASGTTRTRLLVDCGFSLRETEARLQRAGVEASSLAGIFVTHEHGDHIGCARALSQRHGLPLWMSAGTRAALGAAARATAPDDALDRHLRCARDGETIAIGDLLLQPYTVPHDAREPLQLTVSDGRHKLGLLTDAGSITDHVLQHLQGCAALVLECNHDHDLLARSSYPASVKARIGGRHGHLSNETAARILAATLHGGLQHLVAAHLSERNNSPALARAALGAVIGDAGRALHVADPRLGLGWLALHA